MGGQLQWHFSAWDISVVDLQTPLQVRNSQGVFLKECTSISGRSEEGVIEVRGRVYTGLDN
jgi:hypothetical protein